MSREVPAEDLGYATALKLGTHVVAANRDVVQAGEVGGPVQILQRGWAFRYRTWADGKRQILDFLLPGDVIGLESGLLGMSDHSVRALTEVELCQLDSQRLEEMFVRHPRLALALAKHQTLDARRMDAHFAVIGRRSAIERLAYLMLDLFDRQNPAQPGDGRCPFPLRRQHLADATGLTGAHINRTLNTLRRERLAVIEDASLLIHDRAALARLAGSEPPSASPG